MAMTRPNLYGIIDLLEKEMEFHSKICKTSKECKGDKRHQPYLEYCIKEIALYCSVEHIIKRD